MLASRLAFALVALALALPGAAQVKPGDEVYQPTPGQAGKDVVWIPTPDALVTRMLEAVKTTKDDVVYDLGSGDGKIPIAAAKEYGAKAVGIEYNPEMAELARRNVKRAGVDNLVSIITGDIFVEDFSKATVVTMYLLPQLNVKLRPTILEMKPGTRVTSHQFDMGDWEPDQHAEGRAPGCLCVDRPGQCRAASGRSRTTTGRSPERSTWCNATSASEARSRWAARRSRCSAPGSTGTSWASASSTARTTCKAPG